MLAVPLPRAVPALEVTQQSRRCFSCWLLALGSRWEAHGRGVLPHGRPGHGSWPRGGGGGRAAAPGCPQEGRAPAQLCRGAAHGAEPWVDPEGEPRGFPLAGQLGGSTFPVRSAKIPRPAGKSLLCRAPGLGRGGTGCGSGSRARRSPWLGRGFAGVGVVGGRLRPSVPAVAAPPLPGCGEAVGPGMAVTAPCRPRGLFWG